MSALYEDKPNFRAEQPGNIRLVQAQYLIFYETEDNSGSAFFFLFQLSQELYFLVSR